MTAIPSITFVANTSAFIGFFLLLKLKKVALVGGFCWRIFDFDRGEASLLLCVQFASANSRTITPWIASAIGKSLGSLPMQIERTAAEKLRRGENRKFANKTCLPVGPLSTSP